MFPEEHWSEISSQAQSLVEMMLEKDPQKRISLDSVLSHPWVMKPPQYVSMRRDLKFSIILLQHEQIRHCR